MTRASFRSFCFALLAWLGVAAPAEAQDDSGRVSFLGWAREIPRSHSASRDAPAFNWMLLPRGVRTAAGEFALVTIPTADVTVRTGFYGLIELEASREPESFEEAIAQGGIEFWRGAYGYHVATSFDSWARGLCARCGIEAALLFRHESQHYTGSNSGGEGKDYSDRPLVGDFVQLDAALRWGVEDWLLVGRVQHAVFIPGRSGYSQGPGIDLYASFEPWERLHFFASGYAEYRFGAEVEGRAYPDAYLVRGFLGMALPSSVGDILVYFSGDVGHRKGLAVYTEERTLGFGIRLALDPMSGEGRFLPH